MSIQSVHLHLVDLHVLVYILPNTTVETPPWMKMYFLLNMGIFQSVTFVFRSVLSINRPWRSCQISTKNRSVSGWFFGSQIWDQTGGFRCFSCHVKMHLLSFGVPRWRAQVLNSEKLFFPQEWVFGGKKVCKGSVPQNRLLGILTKKTCPVIFLTCHILWRWGVSDVFWALLFRFRCFGLASGSVDVLGTDVTFHVGSGDGGRYGHGCRCLCFCFVAAWCILKEGLECLPYSGNPRLSSGSWWLSFHVATLLEVILLTHRKTAVEEEHALYQKVNCSLSCYFTSRVGLLLNVNAISLSAIYGQVCSFMNFYTYLYTYIYIWCCVVIICIVLLEMIEPHAGRIQDVCRNWTGPCTYLSFG